MSVSPFDADFATAELRAAAAILNDCCLWQAGKWAAELCNGRSLSAPRTVSPSGNAPTPVQRAVLFVHGKLPLLMPFNASMGPFRRHLGGRPVASITLQCNACAARAPCASLAPLIFQSNAVCSCCWPSRCAPVASGCAPPPRYSVADRACACSSGTTVSTWRGRKPRATLRLAAARRSRV